MFLLHRTGRGPPVVTTHRWRWQVFPRYGVYTHFPRVAKTHGRTTGQQNTAPEAAIMEHNTPRGQDSLIDNLSGAHRQLREVGKPLQGCEPVLDRFGESRVEVCRSVRRLKNKWQLRAEAWHGTERNMTTAGQSERKKPTVACHECGWAGKHQSASLLGVSAARSAHRPHPEFFSLRCRRGVGYSCIASSGKQILRGSRFSLFVSPESGKTPDGKQEMSC